MKKKISDEKIITGTFGRMKRVEDFLPSPEDLVFKEDKLVKVTIQLNRSSVNFFKKEAKRLNASYQTMIRNLLDQYTVKHQMD